MGWKNRLRLLFRTVDRFGLLAGVTAWWALVAPGTGLRTVRVPGFAHAVWIRAGTTDVANFEQIFLLRSLDQRRFPQGGALREYAGTAPTPQLIVDGGAYIGLSSVWLAHHYPDAKIIAVEPDPANVAMIRRNAAAWPSIEVVEAGLWDEPTTLFLEELGLEPWGRRLTETANGGPPVATVTINQLMERAGASELLVAKLIIEGSERAVFRSGLDWLDKTHHVIFMPGDWANPGAQAGRTAFAALSARPFDWIVDGQCVHCFRSPQKRWPEVTS